MSIEKLKNKSKQLRSTGMTTRAIAKELSISKSSAHLWTKDILYIDPKIEKAKQLRREGISFNKIAKELGATSRNIKHWTKEIVLTAEQEFNIHSNKNRVYIYNENLFTNPTAIAYYLLGVFISDGNTDKNLRSLHLISKDKAWIKSIAKIFCNEKPVHKRTNENRDYYELSIHSKFITEWFINHECVPAKSLTVKMPTIPNEYFPDFVRGIFDGDGSISMIKNKGKTFKLQAYIVSASKGFAEALSHKLNSIGVKNKLYKSVGKGSRHDSYRVMWQGTPTVKFCELIYGGGGLCLERKREIFKEYLAWRQGYET